MAEMINKSHLIKSLHIKLRYLQSLANSSLKFVMVEQKGFFLACLPIYFNVTNYFILFLSFMHKICHYKHIVQLKVSNYFKTLL